MADFPRRALVSVSDKSGLVPFVQGLVELGFEIISTGGTRKHLEEADIPVMDISRYTNFPEIMAGRVKTLHPKVHGAILGRPELDAEVMAEHGIVPFEVVVCNLYPFEQTIAKAGVTIEEAIEQIDIGGPSMVRSTAKNHAHVAIVTNPSQYPSVLEFLKKGELTLENHRELARAAFEMTAAYDRAIADYFTTITECAPSPHRGEGWGEGEKKEIHRDFSDETKPNETALPEKLSIQMTRKASLRYGENPHQAAGFYVEANAGPDTLAHAEQLNGKELSYNNLLDLDAALAIAREFSDPAIAILKHNNPCGCAISSTLADAFDKAYEGDPVSAFGCIVGSNRPIDLITAERMCEPNRFVEAIIAPDFEPAAFEALTTKPKWKNNVRLMKCGGCATPAEPMLEFRKVSGGLLLQERDTQPDPQNEWKIVTARQPTDDELRDLKFAWLVCKHLKSNAIVLAKDGSLVGPGAGQMSRLDSAFISTYKAGERSRGSVVASDAFFPFRDGIDEAAKAGVTAAIQPGGSRKDEEVIAAANEHNMAMILTGRRHFKH